MADSAVIVHPLLPGARQDRPVSYQVEEAAALAKAIFLDVISTHVANVGRISPATLIGKGKVEELAGLINEQKPSVVILNGSLSPSQQRNLERAWNTKVIDRTGLILEIFGERAQTKEGTLQVDLAQLEYQKSRLVRSWTHLERQRGGAGFMGGPGETQLEMDKRIITDRITKIKKDLEDVRRTRNLARKSREQVPFPIVALVGYTNAGKSTLFNYLTGAGVFAENLLFATLDPTLRRINLPGGQSVIFSDTVGFITDLPTHLIAAFRATLEQVNYADVIIHVRDISRADNEAQKKDVVGILEDLGINYDEDCRVLEVFNKIDLLSHDELAEIKRKSVAENKTLAISAVTGEGIEDLLSKIENIVCRNRKVIGYKIDATDGRALSWLYSHAEIFERKDFDQTINLRISIEPVNMRRFEQEFHYQPEIYGS